MSRLLPAHCWEWLGKSLRSDNIIFFLKSNGDIDYSEPIQCGFDYFQWKEFAVRKFHTMPEEDDADTQIYLDPDTSPDSVKPYLKSYHIYPLGMVFIELAFWLPIEDVLEK